METDKPEERYFTLSYMALHDGQTIWSNCNLSSEKFPNRKQLSLALAETDGIDPETLIIVGIHEFKSKQDYLDYTKE